jgi:hypothetical protein
MTWSVNREGRVIHADLALLADSEWEALLLAVDAELTGTDTSQMVIHAGNRPPSAFREALVDSLTKIVEGQGIKVRVIYTWDS